MSDLTKRLRSGIVQRAEVIDYPPGGARIVNRLDETKLLMAEAADELERLRDIIRRSSLTFRADGSDSESAVDMLNVLGEATSEVKE